MDPDAGAVVLVDAMTTSPVDDASSPVGTDGGSSGSGGSTGSGGSNAPAACASDADCGPDLCAVTHECRAAQDVYSLRVTWKVGGRPASATTCAGQAMPAFGLPSDNFSLTGTFSIPFPLVPCTDGGFIVDRVPSEVRQFAIRGAWYLLTWSIPKQGHVALDLVGIEDSVGF